MFAVRKQTCFTTEPLVLMLAAWLAGLLATTLCGADFRHDSPALLPSMATAQPLCAPLALRENASEVLWQVIDEHAAGRAAAAIEAWQSIDLPLASEVWRRVGLGVAHLQLDRLGDAIEELTRAVELDPENAAVHYFSGLLSMEQAHRALDVPDALRTSTVRMIRREQDWSAASVGETKSHYELAAIESLELALRYAADLDTEEPLLPIRWVMQTPYPMPELTAPPAVGDLLDALGADNFTGKSHGLLAHLYLAHGRPEEAEEHIDQACLLQISVPHGYREVGELYEEQGRSTDAFRAQLKAMQHGDGLAVPGAKAVENLRQAFEEIF